MDRKEWKQKNNQADGAFGKKRLPTGKLFQEDERVEGQNFKLPPAKLHCDECGKLCNLCKCNSETKQKQ